MRGAVAARAGARACLAAALVVTGCATPRLVPVPAPGVEVDAARRTVRVAREGVELAVEPSAWRARPPDLADYVTPLLVRLANRGPAPVDYDETGFRLVDGARAPALALPPDEVVRVLQRQAGAPVRLAAIGSPPPVLHRRILGGPGDAWWDRDLAERWPGAAVAPAIDLGLLALPTGSPLPPGARVDGFLYFRALRGAARPVALEFHYRVGGRPRVLTLPFEIVRARATPRG
jgi:hypothetical protein